jgi:hypothetical protein
MMVVVIFLLVLLYPAAFIGGLIQGKIGVRARALRAPISIAVYVLLALLFVPLVAG